MSNKHYLLTSDREMNMVDSKIIIHLTTLQRGWHCEWMISKVYLFAELKFNSRKSAAIFDYI